MLDSTQTLPRPGLVLRVSHEQHLAGLEPVRCCEVLEEVQTDQSLAPQIGTLNPGALRWGISTALGPSKSMSSESPQTLKLLTALLVLHHLFSTGFVKQMASHTALCLVELLAQHRPWSYGSLDLIK